MPRSSRVLAAALLAALFVQPFQALAGGAPLASLHSYTGIWDMPTARVLPDWTVRIKYGRSEPYRYYGVAVGLFDRLEVHGQFTETSSVIAFPGFGYGHHKDRNAGARLVLVEEDKSLPQIAIGAYDPIGTSLFPSRYLVMSKLLGRFDLTLGLGQGLLGGEAYDAIDQGGGVEGFDTTFLLSSPSRQTRLFGGLEYHARPDLILSAEYSSLQYDKLFGSPDKADWPINLGLKYRLSKHTSLQAAYMRGQELSFGFSADLPLNVEGMLPWRRERAYAPGELKSWQAHQADNGQLAAILARELKEDGFNGVTVTVSDHRARVEYRNNKYHSHAKSFGRVTRLLDALTPPRIQRFQLALLHQGQVVQTLSATRQELRAYMNTTMDKEGFLQYADLSPYNGRIDQSQPARADGHEARRSAGASWFDYDFNFRIKTFLNNKAGFFKHKAFLQPQAFITPWKNGILMAEMEFTLLNEYEEVIFGAQEPQPTRTDVVLYERESRPRLSVLAYDQFLPLPWNVLGRLSAGYFETAYAGVGGELFRTFQDGRFGIGLESTLVRKRDPEDNFKLSDTITKTYGAHFLNLYGLLWPSQGLEAGLKIGRFMADDLGFRLELRRSYKYFTLGAWYTKTDTDHMVSPDNIGTDQKGVFIRFPLSIFADHDRRGHLRYTFSSFTRDAGAIPRQPSTLFPIDPYQTTTHTRNTLDDMRYP